MCAESNERLKIVVQLFTRWWNRPTGVVLQGSHKKSIEERLERIFHPQSYGYRPMRSTHQALDQVRKNYWKYDWAIDLDIKNFFDDIDHDKLRKALGKHVKEKWVLK